MDQDKQFCVYMMAGLNGVLYVGVTRNLPRRVLQHKLKTAPGFTWKYNCNRLVWFECGGEAIRAFEREKKIKSL
jgi:putative endonuclease